MPHEVNVTDEVWEWWGGLDVTQQEDIAARVELLERYGPTLGRPVVDRVASSAFDPRREAILLLGGDKSGDWSKWYERAVPEADRLYMEYLRELRREGLIE